MDGVTPARIAPSDRVIPSKLYECEEIALELMSQSPSDRVISSVIKEAGDTMAKAVVSIPSDRVISSVEWPFSLK